MKIATWNVNGLRSVNRNGFNEWLTASGIDILCIQEIKIDEGLLLPEHKNIGDYVGYFNHAEKKGYAGTGIYTRLTPVSVTRNVFGDTAFMSEGRSMLIEFDDVSILNVYMPHGGRDKSKLAYKLEAYRSLLLFLDKYDTKPLVLAGDFNIAHDDLDLARPKQNRKNIMFTEEERQQIDTIIDRGFLDAYRTINPEDTGYTWWPYMAKARERNIGWRIDYLFTAASIKNSIHSFSILDGVLGADHCPALLELLRTSGLQ